MARRLDAFFAPDATLLWHAPIGTRPGFYRQDGDRRVDVLVRFLLREAGLDDKNSIRIGVDQVDAVLAAAARHGFCLEWVGGPDDELSPFVPRPPQVPA